MWRMHVLVLPGLGAPRVPFRDTPAVRLPSVIFMRGQQLGAVPWQSSIRPRICERIPGDLGVVVTVVVDEPGRHDPPIGLDHLTRGAAQTAQLHDLPPRHRRRRETRGGPSRR